MDSARKEEPGDDDSWDDSEPGEGEGGGRPRVVVTYPKTAAGSPTVEGLLRQLRRIYPGWEVFGPGPYWDDFYSVAAPRTYLRGCESFVFAGWKGEVSRGVYHMVRARPLVLFASGPSALYAGGKFYRTWEFTPYGEAERSKMRWARVRAVGAGKRRP